MNATKDSGGTRRTADGKAASDRTHQPRTGAAAGVSASEPDWSRERPHALWDPSRRLLRAIRGYQRAETLPPGLRWVARKYWALQHRFWSVVTGADIPVGCKIGGGLLLPHPNGVVLHPDSVIGVNCLLFQQVTLGTDASGSAPVLGGHVDIGAGAKILGRVTVGDHARIGANAVVLSDIPEDATAVGIPARIIKPITD